MKIITLFYFILLFGLLAITFFPSITETFSDININIPNPNPNLIRRRRVLVPIYAPWRMYYPYELVYPFTVPWQNPSFYPFADQYNIYQNMIPY